MDMILEFISDKPWFGLIAAIIAADTRAFIASVAAVAVTVGARVTVTAPRDDVDDGQRPGGVRVAKHHCIWGHIN